MLKSVQFSIVSIDNVNFRAFKCVSYELAYFIFRAKKCPRISARPGIKFKFRMMYVHVGCKLTPPATGLMSIHR